MARSNNSEERSTPLKRGLEAEAKFKKLLGEGALKSNAINDRFDHYDFMVKFDVKKIRAEDEFGESTYHYIEIMNVSGHKGWLYGEAHYIAFETKNYWVIVSREKLQDFVKSVVTNTELVFEKEPYRIYRRKDRLDRVVMVPTIDLCYLGFMQVKEQPFWESQTKGE